MFETFTHRRIDTSEAVINLRHAGSGPPVLLLHGHPQTHAMWHKVAPRLAETYSVVCADLRGYGDSSKPPTTEDHAPYSKRAMARDMVEVMQALGFERFAVVGHDRGGRCAYRMALDHPERISRSLGARHHPHGRAFPAHGHVLRHGLLALVLPRPAASDPRAPDRIGSRRVLPAPRTRALRRGSACRIPPLLHRSGNDPRHVRGLPRRRDHRHALDEEDQKAGRRIACPVQALWARKNGLDRWYDVPAVWRDWADSVEGHSIDCGHYLAEEAPEETLAALEPFLARAFLREES